MNSPSVDNKNRQTDNTNRNIYYVADHLGSTIALTDDSGSMVEGIGYDSFGDCNGNTIADYLNGPGIDNKLRQTGGGVTLYFIQDHLIPTVRS